MDNYLTINENGKINTAFFKANSYLIKKHKTDLSNLGSDLEKSTLLETLWSKEFKATVIKKDSPETLATEKWQMIEFLSKSDLTMFMLRWG